MDRVTLSEALLDVYNEDTGASLTALSEDVRLVADLGLDSIDVVSLIMQIERQFRIRLSRDDLQSVTTFGDLLSLVSTKLHQGSSNRAA